MKNVNIKGGIDARLVELSISAGKTTKLIGDIAETRLNDFMVVRTVPVRQRVETYANVVLQSIKEQIVLVQGKVNALEKKEAGAFRSMLTKLWKQEAEMELEVLRFGKTALVYVEGALVLEERAELGLVVRDRAPDAKAVHEEERAELGLVALAKAKDGGRLSRGSPPGTASKSRCTTPPPRCSTWAGCTASSRRTTTRATPRLCSTPK